MTRASFGGTALRMSAGVIVWAVHFAVIYGFAGYACARGLPGPVPWVVGIATLVAAAACVAIAAGALFPDEGLGMPWRRAGERRFPAWMSASLALFALVAVVWEALPILWVAPCH